MLEHGLQVDNIGRGTTRERCNCFFPIGLLIGHFSVPCALICLGVLYASAVCLHCRFERQPLQRFGRFGSMVGGKEILKASDVVGSVPRVFITRPRTGRMVGILEVGSRCPPISQ